MIVARMAVCAALLMVLSVLATQLAQAAPALATNNVNLRQGPGTNFPVIATIPGGSQVEIGGCSGQWCNVTWQGHTGYSIATSFDQGGPNGAEGAPPPGATAGGPVPAGPPGAPPPGYPPPPPGYYPPPYYPGYGPYPYYGPGYYGRGYYGPYGYGPYWRRRYW